MADSEQSQENSVEDATEVQDPNTTEQQRPSVQLSDTPPPPWIEENRRSTDEQINSEQLSVTSEAKQDPTTERLSDAPMPAANVEHTDNDSQRSSRSTRRSSGSTGSNKTAPKVAVPSPELNTTTIAEKEPEPSSKPIASRVIYFDTPKKPEVPPREPSPPPELNTIAEPKPTLPSDAAPKTAKVRAKPLPKKPPSLPEPSSKPIASKVIYSDAPKKPEVPPEPAGVPLLIFADKKIQETEEEKQVDEKLNKLIDDQSGKVYKALLDQNKRPKEYRLGGMVDALKRFGIPCPVNDDFSRLHGTHRRWDPEGNVIEYYSPMLRAILPVNMRGRYRGCWTTDDCMLGVDVSKISPKRDALEGFVERGRYKNIQEKYDTMSSVGIDVPHLDYLIEIESYQAETLPLPIFFDMLHLGMEVSNENLRILVNEDGYPPNDPVYLSANDHAERIRRKLKLYEGLGLEKLGKTRVGIWEYMPMWLRTRDQIIREIVARKDNDRYAALREVEGIEKGHRTSNDQELDRLIKTISKFDDVKPTKGSTNGGTTRATGKRKSRKSLAASANTSSTL